jgi:hypothetical protein
MYWVPGAKGSWVLFSEYGNMVGDVWPTTLGYLWASSKYGHGQSYPEDQLEQAKRFVERFVVSERERRHEK